MSKDKSLIQNILHMGIFQITNYLVPLIAIPILINRIGLDNYGIVVLAQGIMHILVAISDFGFNMTGTRLISQNSENKSMLTELISNILILKTILLLVGFLILIILASIIPKWHEHMYLIVMSYTMVIGQAYFPVWYFQGIQRMSRIVILNFISRIFYIFYIYFFIQEVTDAPIVNLVNGLSVILICIIGNFWMYRQTSFKIKIPEFKDLLSFTKSNVSIFISNFMVDGHRVSGILIAGFFLSGDQLGLFGVIDKIIALINNSFAAIYRALFPKISSLISDSTNQIRVIFRAYYFKFGFAVIVGLIGFVLFGSELFPLISDQISVEDIAPYTPLIAVISFLIFISLPISVSLLSFDLKNYFLIYNTLMLVLFVSSATILTGPFGVTGLLSAHIISGVLVFGISLFLLKRKSIRLI